MFISAARSFYTIAEQVEDSKCKAALIFMAASAIQRVEDLTKAATVATQSSSQAIPSKTPAPNDEFEIRSNRFVFEGRVTLPAARTEIKGIRDVSSHFFC